MKCFRVPRRLLICLVGFVICTPFARANDARSSHSISHEEAERHATDSDSYTKLCGDVALKIEAEVHWTGIAKHDADAALVEFKPFDPEWFQVHVGNILAMDADPYDFTSNEKWNAWNTGFNKEFRKDLHNKEVVQ